MVIRPCCSPSSHSIFFPSYHLSLLPSVLFFFFFAPSGSLIFVTCFLCRIRSLKPDKSGSKTTSLWLSALHSWVPPCSAKTLKLSAWSNSSPRFWDLKRAPDVYYGKASLLPVGTCHSLSRWSQLSTVVVSASAGTPVAGCASRPRHRFSSGQGCQWLEVKGADTCPGCQLPLVPTPVLLASKAFNIATSFSVFLMPSSRINSPAFLLSLSKVIQTKLPTLW